MDITEKFRIELFKEGVRGVESYIWDNEPLYRGEPIHGRMTDNERRAAQTIYDYLNRGGANSAWNNNGSAASDFLMVTLGAVSILALVFTLGALPALIMFAQLATALKF